MQIESLTLNFNEVYYNFYDWLNDDKILTYKNINLKVIETSDLYNIMANDVDIKNEFKSVLLLTDTFNFVAVMKQDNKILKSSLTLKDEFKLINKISNLPKEKINYKIIKKREVLNECRSNSKIRLQIERLLTDLINDNEISKLEYYYYEWFGKKDPLEKMKLEIEKKLAKPIGIQEEKLYELLKYSNKV